MKLVSVSLPCENKQTDLLFSAEEASKLLWDLRDIARVSSLVDLGSLTILRLCLLHRGGKGGFGKLLKSQKNLGKNTNNFDSCRDLDRRKLKYAREEEKIDVLKKKEKRDQDKRDSVEILPAKPSVSLDEAYIKKLSTIGKEKQDAVSDGLRSSKEEDEMKPVEPPPSKKLKKIAFFDEEDSE